MSATRLPSARRTARNAAWIVVLLAAMLAFLSSCAQPGSPREGQTEPTSQVEPDENEPDEDEKDRERDEREADEREADENEADENDADENEADENEADENEGGRDEA